uniref:Uncharacterized protein n=1 Tax=Streptomyces griseus TaxID=1911 RepID=Q9S4C9_STRGR|nr:unknown [Streptomyces griseus]
MGGVFLVYGALEVPEGDRGEVSSEPGGGPEVFDRTGQESPGGVPGGAGPGGVTGVAGRGGNVRCGGFEEVGEFGDAGVLGYVSAPAGGLRRRAG